MIEIPTFEVGEKVRLHFRPYEMLCPKCGALTVPPDHKHFNEEARIEVATRLIKIGTCGCVIPMPEGFYHVSFGTNHVGVPYTLLGRIKE